MLIFPVVIKSGSEPGTAYLLSCLNCIAEPEPQNDLAPTPGPTRLYMNNFLEKNMFCIVIKLETHSSKKN
jgi:hypothetical protein